MVHQEFMLVRRFSVVENTVLGLNEDAGPMLDLRQAARRLRSLSDQHHLAIDPDAQVQHLPSACNSESKSSSCSTAMPGC